MVKRWSVSGKVGNRSLINNLQLITYLIFSLLFWQIVLQTHKFAVNNSYEQEAVQRFLKNSE